MHAIATGSPSSVQKEGLFLLIAVEYPLKFAAEMTQISDQSRINSIERNDAERLHCENPYR